MKFLLSIITALIVSAVASQAQDDKVKTKFTLVYLHQQQDSSDFQELSGLHFSYGDVDVPLPIKAFRQSILYPYLGSNKLSLYKLESREGELVRVPVVSTTIPAGAERGVLVLTKNKGALSITPFWFKSGELRQGARFVNLWNTKMLLYKNGKNKKLLAPRGHLDIKPAFSNEDLPSYVQLSGYAQVKKDGALKKMKMLNRNLAMMKNRPMLVIAYQKNKFASSMKALSLEGQISVNQYESLYELLPQLRPKVVKEHEDKENGPANEWEKGAKSSNPEVTKHP